MTGFSRIRYDAGTKQASVIDVIRIITQTDYNHAYKVFRRLEAEVRSKCAKFRFAGKKQRRTPVARVHVLVQIIWKNRVKIAKELRHTCSEYIYRIFRDDPIFVE